MSLISSIAQVFTISSSLKVVTAYLVPLDDTDAPDTDKVFPFQYFPETITDSKSSNWNEKNIPGGSHPLYQWISGGGRTISFTAVFSNEKNPEPPGGLSLGALVGSLLNSKDDIHSQNCAVAIASLRGYMYPTYADSAGSSIGRVKAPPKAMLVLPGSGIVAPSSPGIDSITCVMTQCDIVYEGFYRMGAPRLVSVQLSFSEIIQIGDTWSFDDREDIWGGNNGLGDVFDTTEYDKEQIDSSTPGAGAEL